MVEPPTDRTAAPGDAPRGGLRELRKVETRARILEACETLYRTRGFDETSIDDILGAAGISRQTFFNYFAGKDAVLAEVALQWLRRQGAVPSIPHPLPENVSVLRGMRKAIREQAAAIAADRRFMRTVFTRSRLFAPVDSEDGAAGGQRARHQATTRTIFEAVAAVIRAGQEHGEIRPDLDPLATAEVLVSALLMSIRLWLTDYWGTGETLPDRLARVMDILESGLATRS